MMMMTLSFHGEFFWVDLILFFSSFSFPTFISFSALVFGRKKFLSQQREKESEEHGMRVGREASFFWLQDLLAPTADVITRRIPPFSFLTLFFFN